MSCELHLKAFELCQSQPHRDAPVYQSADYHWWCELHRHAFGTTCVVYLGPPGIWTEEQRNRLATYCLSDPQWSEVVATAQKWHQTQVENGRFPK